MNNLLKTNFRKILKFSDKDLILCKISRSNNFDIHDKFRNKKNKRKSNRFLQDFSSKYFRNLYFRYRNKRRATRDLAKPFSGKKSKFSTPDFEGYAKNVFSRTHEQKNILSVARRGKFFKPSNFVARVARRENLADPVEAKKPTPPT